MDEQYYKDLDSDMHRLMGKEVENTPTSSNGGIGINLGRAVVYSDINQLPKRTYITDKFNEAVEHCIDHDDCLDMPSVDEYPQTEGEMLDWLLLPDGEPWNPFDGNEINPFTFL